MPTARSHRARAAQRRRLRPGSNLERGHITRSARLREMTAPTGTEPTTQETDLARDAASASAWAGESLVHGGENPAVALAEGTARRAALDAARQEMAEGRTEPSPEFRRRFAPHARPGADPLRGHARPGLGPDAAAPPGRRPRRHAGRPDRRRRAGRRRRGRDQRRAHARRTATWTRTTARASSRSCPTGTRRSREEPSRAPPDPGARRRYRFKHPTASGKTVAAAGFVEACRTVGVLILTHRRLLVDQFHRDLKEQGYGGRAALGRSSAASASPSRRRSRSRPTPGSSSTPTRSTPTPTGSSSATRPTRRSASARAPPSAASPARPTSG